MAREGKKNQRLEHVVWPSFLILSHTRVTGVGPISCYLITYILSGGLAEQLGGGDSWNPHPYLGPPVVPFSPLFWGRVPLLK